jgi:taurine dioxygenase
MEVAKVSDAIGVAITGVDLSQPIADDVRQQLRELFDREALLVFRNQKLTKQDVVNATAIFGECEIHPVEGVRDDEVPELITLATHGKRGDIVHPDGEVLIGWQGWHTDLGYTTKPCRGAILYEAVHPAEGGKTGFINCVKAYEALPQATKDLIDDKHVVQSWAYVHTVPAISGNAAFKTKDGSRSPDIDKFPDVIYPLVIRHPVTGAKVLNCPPLYSADIVEMPGDDGRKLLDDLIVHLTSGPFTYWHDYGPGDAVVWDNWQTNHAAGGSKAKYNRVMWRTTIKGDVVLGQLIPKGMATSTRQWRPLTDFDYVPDAHAGLARA